MLRVTLLVGLFALATAACGGGLGEPSTTASDATGGTTAIPTPGLPATFTGADGVENVVENATRIVTLSGDMTEIVFALGLGGNIVGADLSSVYPEEARAMPKVGVEFVLSAEAVLAQAPTVVIGDEDARPLEAIEQIRQAGVPVVIFPRFVGLGAPAEKIRAVAHVLGVDAAGEALATRVQGEIDAVVALAAGVAERPRVALVYVASGRHHPHAGPGLGDGRPLRGGGGGRCVPGRRVRRLRAPLGRGFGGRGPRGDRHRRAGPGRLPGRHGRLPAAARGGETTAGREQRILVYEDLFLLGLGPRTGQLLARLFAASPSRGGLRLLTGAPGGAPPHGPPLRARVGGGAGLLILGLGVLLAGAAVASLAIGAVDVSPGVVARIVCITSGPGRSRGLHRPGGRSRLVDPPAAPVARDRGRRRSGDGGGSPAGGLPQSAGRPAVDRGIQRGRLRHHGRHRSRRRAAGRPGGTAGGLPGRPGRRGRSCTRWPATRAAPKW